MNDTNIWVIIGVVFLILEIVSVSFYALFFGVAGLLTALLTYLGLLDDLTSQIILFAVSSIGSMYLFRKKFTEWFTGKGEDFKEIIDEFATVSAEIKENSEGKVFYRGSDWIAYETSGKPVASQSKVIIKKIDGIKLIVEAV